MAKLTVFKIYEDCYTKKSKGLLYEDPEFESAMNNYMLCRIFRMNDTTIWIAEKLNKYQTLLSKKDFYLFAYSICKFRPRAPFSDFIKKPSKKEENEPKKNRLDDEGYLVI